MLTPQYVHTVARMLLAIARAEQEKMESQKTVKTFRLGLKPPGQDKKIRRAGDNTILSSEIITNQKIRDHKKLNHHYHSH